MEEMLGLYMKGELSIKSLLQKIKKLEVQILNLENERDEYRVKLRATKNEVKEQSSNLPIQEMEDLIKRDENDIGKKQAIMDKLEVKGVLNYQTGILFADMTCRLGNKEFTKVPTR